MARPINCEKWGWKTNEKLILEPQKSCWIILPLLSCQWGITFFVWKKLMAVFPSPFSSSFSNQDPVVWLPKMKTTFPSHVVAGWHHTNKCITFNDRKAEVLRANFKCPQRKSYVLCCFFLLVACTGINNLDLDYPSWTMRPRVYHRTKYELEVVWIANFMKQSSELL